MSTVKMVNPVHIQNGDSNNTQDPSACCIPGSEGYTSVYFGVDMYVDVAVTDDKQVWIALAGGTASHTNNRLTKGSGAWEGYWGIANYSFSYEGVDQLPNGGHYIADMEVEPDPGTACNATLYFTDAPDVHVGDTSFPDGWYCIGTVDDLDTDHKSWFKFWISFPVKNTNGQSDFKTMYSTEIKVDGDWVPKIFDYYPWARHTAANDTWYSHNRDGGSLTRYNSGWQDVKNGGATDHGFRYDGSAWAVSPKTGQE